MEVALLVAERASDLQVVAVGTVEGGARTAFQGVRNLDVRVRFVANDSIPLSGVRATLTRREQVVLDQILSGQLRPLSPKLGQNLLRELIEQNPGLSEVMKAIRDQTNAERVARAQLRQSRPTALSQEAMSSALRFFGTAWHTLTPEPAPSPSGFALGLEDLISATENDVITDDASVFPGWGRATYSRGGWWEFHNKERRLLVKNINVSPQEARTGADLVYVRRDPDAFVLVQYKLLDELEDGRPVFRPDGRLDRQVQRMLELEDTYCGCVPTDATSTYRIGDGFSFVKFVEPSASRPERPGQLVPGYYMPSEFVRRLLTTPGVGPRGGAVHCVVEQRHISPETFARLVRDSWVGSTGDATALLRQVLGIRDTDAGLVLAVDEPAGEPSANT
jgi:hypothetical protein